MWSSLIPIAPEGISVDDFFTKFVPDQFIKMNAMLTVVDLSFLAGKDFNMTFDVEGKVYGIKFKNGKDLEVINGAVDKSAVTLYISEKDWRDAVTGKFNKMADDFSGDPTSFIDAKRYSALLSTNGTVIMNLKKDDGGNLPLKIVFNNVEKPSVTVNLDMVDAMAMVNKATTGQALFMNGKLKFTGDMVLLMKLQTLM
ncbi:MAG: SCP2 sterol-binding domain-containing protein [Deltaproteobacteria bacterium]|nr:SCP2 sterol-binding domain-containing protein [Deltaproteobacteria bacterium]